MPEKNYIMSTRKIRIPENCLESNQESSGAIEMERLNKIEEKIDTIYGLLSKIFGESVLINGKFVDVANFRFDKPPKK